MRKPVTVKESLPRHATMNEDRITSTDRRLLLSRLDQKMREDFSMLGTSRGGPRGKTLRITSERSVL